MSLIDEGSSALSMRVLTASRTWSAYVKNWKCWLLKRRAEDRRAAENLTLGPSAALFGGAVIQLNEDAIEDADGGGHQRSGVQHQLGVLDRE